MVSKKIRFLSILHRFNSTKIPKIKKIKNIHSKIYYTETYFLSVKTSELLENKGKSAPESK